MTFGFTWMRTRGVRFGADRIACWDGRGTVGAGWVCVERLIDGGIWGNSALPTWTMSDLRGRARA